jgi:hypothetical protein
MMPIKRQNNAALLLVLLLSHAALTLHVSTHIPIDQNNCDYCAAHADPSHAITPSIAHLPLSAALELVAPAAAPLPQATTSFSYRQRARPYQT